MKKKIEHEKLDNKRKVDHDMKSHSHTHITQTPHISQLLTHPHNPHTQASNHPQILKTPIIEIGYVTSGKGVFLQEENNHVILKDLGWKHFK